ncbi:MAG: hypothetical protein QOH31_4442 [Verrucomicrobiota bacterium]|jgi:hypothetical protein
MTTVRLLLLCSLVSLSTSADLRAFCGFYVAKADTKIFNQASKVVMVRDADRTVLTLANDFQGDAKDFAVVIPVPIVLEKGQIHVGENALIDHLDAYSAPRLVEYWDPDPCATPMPRAMIKQSAPTGAAADRDRAEALGVKIEAQYTVGEYDIVILSAEQSNGLETWLTENGYKIPSGAASVLDSYIKQNLRFFVARVNLQEKEKLGFTYLRPLQMAYESGKFMLPIRLGTVNANGPQELFVFALSRQGRVETTNYRTVKLNSDLEVPLFVKDDFSHFYRSMFDRAVQREDMRVVFLEYAWDMGWCDPCAAEPLSNDELRKLGVFWLEDIDSASGKAGINRPIPRPYAGTDVFITRLHLRYDSAHFPEDLAFQQTGDRTNFQGRYILRHPWTGDAKCDAARAYLKSLDTRYRTEAENLASLTGWDIQEIYQKMNFRPTNGNKKWWQKIWQ